MKLKTALLAGLAAGYVLGAKAGRERYEQIRSAARQLADNPGVQRLSQEVNKTVAVGKERVTEAASRSAEQASNNIAGQVGKAREFVAKAGPKEGEPAPRESTMTSSGTVPSTTGPSDQLP
ncbi:MAG TPA: hypothetical protein VGM21_03810 [Actinomycetota bacterium]|jgi:hypothetical protein